MKYRMHDDRDQPRFVSVERSVDGIPWQKFVENHWFF